MTDEETKQEEQASSFTEEQEKLAKQRAEEPGVCVTCGQARWYCGGEYAHLRKKQLGEE